VGLTGPSLHGTASLRSSEAMVHAIMSRGGTEAMFRAAEVVVREETSTSPYRAAALGLLGLATMIRGDDEVADSLFAEASEVGLRIGGMPIASLALAERSLIATSRSEGDAAQDLAARARGAVRDAHLDEHITTGPVHAASARAALRAGDHEAARAELAAAHRLRPILTWAFPTIAVQTRLELARVHVGLSDVPGARTLLAEVDEILAHRPDLGTLTTQAVELRTHIGSVRSGRSPGPTTLTAAELRLLTFLPTHLSFREIGARLFVSPNTVKTQAISVYRKLGVSTRSDAVQAARDLRLLEP
jgi:LuxR family transcriptional regulator, maltose regulon positive regulatory protein